jgi:hypothetical protein
MRLLPALALLGLTLLAPPARAAGPDQTDPKFAARALADHGYALYQAGKYPAAIEAFEAADKLFHAPTLVFARAKAHAALGKLIEARALFQRVVDERLPANAPEAFVGAQNSAKTEIAGLDQRIPTLEITAAGAGGRRLKITVDDVEIPAVNLGRPLPQNPGGHVVVIVPLGSIGRSRSVNLAEGAHERVAIDLAVADDPAPPPPLARAAARPLPPPPAPRGVWIVPTAVSFGVGAAGLGVGIATGVIAERSVIDLRSRCGGGKVCPSSEEGNLSSVKGVAAASTAGFILAGAGIVTGVVLLAVRPGSTPASPARAALVAGPGAAFFQGVF